MRAGEEKAKKKAWNIPCIETMQRLERKLMIPLRRGRKDTLREPQRTKEQDFLIINDYLEL